MHLHGNCSRLGLTFTLQGRTFAQVGQVLAANFAHFCRNHPADLVSAAVVERHLQVHLGLAAQPFDVGDELALVGADGAPQSVVICEDGAKAEGKDS